MSGEFGQKMSSLAMLAESEMYLGSHLGAELKTRDLNPVRWQLKGECVGIPQGSQDALLDGTLGSAVPWMLVGGLM